MLSDLKNSFTIGFLFLFFLISLLIFRPFIFQEKGSEASALLIAPADFTKFVFGKAFLRNIPETPTEQFFKQEVEQQARIFPKHFFIERIKKTSQSIYKRKQIALTFDDSPDDWYCPQVLNILDKYKVKATFFLIANRLKTYRNNAEEIKRKGHLIGNHSYSHTKFTMMTTGQVLQDLDSAENAFQEILQTKPTFFRPPYGIITNEQVDALVEQKYKIINWSVDTYDWDTKRNSPLELFTRVEQYVHDGAIILFHSSGRDRENTIQALPLIIKSLQERGFEFVRLDEWF
jgi:peptidoglycan-N-acetylglucosamine deacetylase